MIDSDGEGLQVGVASTLVWVRHAAVAIDPAEIIRSLTRCHQREDPLPTWKSDERAENTLIVAKHEEAIGGDESDVEIELLARELLPTNAPFGQVAHLQAT